MTDREIKNLSASIYARLLNNSKKTNRPFNEVLQYYAIERFLYRLSESEYADKFILKGALMFLSWGAVLTRPTRDIDMLGRTKNDIENLVNIIRKVCRQKVEADGMEYFAPSVYGEKITENADYAGIRIIFDAKLDNAKVKMQIDVGFGDEVFPEISKITYPVIIELPAPVLKGYSMESVIAEKFESMMKLGMLNSRMKDFFDIWMLSLQFQFDGFVLSQAIHKTFDKRGTIISEEVTAFSKEFVEEKIKQWKAFLRKSRLSKEVPDNFEEIIRVLKKFLLPAVKAVIDKKAFRSKWDVSGKWVQSN